MPTENIFNIPENFDGNCEVALTTLNQCVTDYIEYIASCATAAEMIAQANINISGVTHVSCRTVDEDSSILTNVHTIADKIETKAQELSIYLASVKEYKHLMDTGGDPSAIEALVGMLQSNKIISFMADNNLIWVIDEALIMTKVAGLSALGTLLSYGTDASNEGGSFVVDGVVQNVFNKSMLWGAGAAAVFIAFKDIYFDEGNFTVLDAQRTVLDSLEGAVLVGEWSIITNAVSAGMLFGELGCLGGPIGAVVAGIAGVITSIALDTVFSWITGDNVVYTATTEDGREIPIYANGNGRNGTYDVLLEKSDIYGREYSNTNYKQMIYENPEIEADAWNSQRHWYQASKTTDGVQQLYDMLANCNSADEAKVVYENIMYGYQGDPVLSNTCVSLNGAGFDPEEYYNYATTGSIYGEV